MEYIITETSKETNARVPKIGEVFRHKGYKWLWMRVDPYNINKHFCDKETFPCVCLDDGQISRTRFDNNFEFLVEPVEFKF